MNPFDISQFDVFEDTLKVWKYDTTPEKLTYTTYMGRQLLTLANPELFYNFSPCARVPHFHFSPSRQDRRTPEYGLSEHVQPQEIEDLNQMLQTFNFTKRGVSFFLYKVSNFSSRLCEQISLQKLFKRKGSSLEICKNLPGLTFENDKLIESQKSIIYHLIGRLWDVRRRNTMILGGAKSDVFVLDIDSGHAGKEDSYDIFVKLCEDNGIDWTKLCTGRSKSDGRHVYFDYEDFLTGRKGGPKSRSPIDFVTLIKRDGTKKDVGWDIRNSGTGVNALGVFYHEDKKIWTACHFIFNPFIEEDEEDDLETQKVAYSAIAHMSHLNLDVFNKDAEYKNVFLLVSLFINPEIYEDKEGKYRVEDVTLEQIRQFFDVTEFAELEIKKNPVNSRGLIKDTQSFELIREIFQYYDHSYVSGQTKKMWLYKMSAIKNAVYGNGKELESVAIAFYWNHCLPYVNADKSKVLGRSDDVKDMIESEHRSELMKEWAAINCEDPLYATIQGVIRQLMSIRKSTFRIPLQSLSRKVKFLIKQLPQDPFQFQERVNALTFSSFSSIDNLEIERNLKDMTTDILNDEGRLLILDPRDKCKYTELLFSKSNNLQEYIKLMKRTLCYVINDGKSYYLVKTFDEQGKLIIKNTLIKKEWMDTAEFEKSMNIKKGCFLLGEKEIEVTALQIIKKFRDYITFDNIRRDFDTQYSYNGKDVTERYLSLYSYQALSYDCERKDEDKNNFLRFFINTIGHMCDMTESETAIEIENFKNKNPFTNATLKFVIYWLSNMLTDWRHKNGTSLYISSSPGSGKTKFFEYFEEHVIGDAYCCATDENEIINNRFNSALIGRLLVRVEEVTAKKVEDAIDKLKIEVTNTKSRREKKGVDSFEEKSFNRMVLMTNDSHYMGDENRRFLYLNAKKTEDENYKKMFMHYFENSNNKDYARVLYDYLVSLPSKKDQFNFIDELKIINDTPSPKNFYNRLASMSSIQRYIYDLIGNKSEPYFPTVLDGIHRVEVMGLYEHYQKANANNKLTKENFQKKVFDMFGADANLEIKPYSKTKRQHFIFNNLKQALRHFFQKRNLIDRYNEILRLDDLEDEIVAELIEDDRTVNIRMNRLAAIVNEPSLEKRLQMLRDIEDEYAFEMQ